MDFKIEIKKEFVEYTESQICTSIDQRDLKNELEEEYSDKIGPEVKVKIKEELVECDQGHLESQLSTSMDLEELKSELDEDNSENNIRPKYQRTSTRNSWSETSMAEAVRKVLDGTMGFKRAANSYGVPKSTLERKVKKAHTNALAPEAAAVKKLGRYETVFNAEQEKQLVEHALTLKERLLGITLTDIRMLAFELAERNNIKHKFNTEKRMAGKFWLYSFLRRHKELSFRNPEPTKVTRAKGIDRTVVNTLITS
ncbi:uncharacterized protein LOC114326374 isoform X3 [Diabrotica virgifera virgifera]|uniref:HTH CENPB-type domain-containing protein n=1 Tax=Diabrotica virgifera virgifera TaxID=50390 RepID=A0ABM5IDN1_DIAVI|nr:uncharacterized protein LOC114326374 isoform X3 [Diabrotica virgifera virgifera]